MLVSAQLMASAQASEMAAHPAWGCQVDLVVVLVVVHPSLLVASVEDYPPILRVLEAKKQVVGTHRSGKHNLQHPYAPKFPIFHEKTAKNGRFLVQN